MDIDRLLRWKPVARFTPNTNDLLYVRPGVYAQETKVDLILRWRVQAEEQALNAILLMMTGGLT